MNFPSIDIQGSILSSDLLSKIRSEQATYQSGKDFRPDFTNAKLKDEISFAWQEAKGQWTIYKSKLARMKPGDVGTTETRNFWILPLLTNLGYNLTFSRQAEEINGKLFPIGYHDTTLDNFPIYVGGYHESLDKRPENKMLRVSPHAMVQEYLNHSEHMYGIVTNGTQLRLLRDASRITRLSYVEFNLEKMLEEDLYSDFVILYRILHASRMPKKADNGAESIIEKYHQEGLEAGSAIRSKLGDAVKQAIKNLANGFINHPNNHELREAMQNGKFNIDEYYRHQLRIIYRLLFLFVIEERNLVYADSKTPETKRFNEIYFKYYSLMRIRKLARKLAPPDAHRHFDLWRSLVATFALFEKKQIGEKLGIMSLQGDLFGYHSLTSSSFDLHDCDVSNAIILNIINSLTYFENDKGVLIAVNYGGLDVEEFGSVYEGLLELKLAISKVEGTETYSCGFDASTERGKSGSHYTPEELVQPLIKHSLDYLIADKLKERDQAAALLSLKVVDVACGSGHILLSAARRITHELASIMETRDSGSKEKIEQPSPAYVRRAMKEVVRNCIYGVDKNPLAVELCKVALWLEAYNPGEPLNFLDHHIKCGDAIVGLAHRDELERGIPDEAFKSLPGDDKTTAKAWRDKNAKERKEREAKALQLKAEFEKLTESSVQESMAEYRSFTKLPESTPEEIEKKAKAYKNFIDGKGFTFLRAMADTQVAQFFIHKTSTNKDYLMTDADFRTILSGYNKSWQDRKVAKATAMAIEHRFFHWFIEFPEVFSKGGFDCILGNPPFLGGKKISSHFGENYVSSIKWKNPEKGSSDLVGFFFRRSFEITTANGFVSLIATNTICQGGTREFTLDFLVKKGATINHAVKSIKWPGKASVEIALVSFTKQRWQGKFTLGGKEVRTITPYLDDADTIGNPFTISKNLGKSFIGTYVLGKGFILTNEEAKSLLSKDVKNKDVLYQYLIGDDLNNDPKQSPSRWVINFHEWPLRNYRPVEWAELSETDRVAKKKPLLAEPGYQGPVAEDYPDCLQIVNERVRAEREEIVSTGNQIHTYSYWHFWDPRPALYRVVRNMNKVMAINRHTKYIQAGFVETSFIYSDATVVFALDGFSDFAIFSSNLHTEWAWKNSATMGSNTLRYSPTDCFETFSFPSITKKHQQSLESIGEAYHEHRRQLMLRIQLGLTKTYNLFHSNAITAKAVNEKDKQVVALQKHLEKTANTISYIEAIQGILQLRELHVQMDEAVLEAYGWSDIALRHDFYEVDYLPENDRSRFAIHPDARKEILKRLLELNHKIHQEEVKAGLWDKKKSNSKRKKANTVNEPEPGYGSLFSN